MLKYFCQNTNPKHLGKTKLMKLFYFLDFTHVKKYGAPITGDTYFHLEKGPIPSAIKNLIDSLDDEPELSILADTIEIQKNMGSMMHKIVCSQNFADSDKEYFSEIEMQTLKFVCDKYSDYTTREIVDASHAESPWRKTQECSQIPYSLAADDPDCEVEKAEIELLSKV